MNLFQKWNAGKKGTQAFGASELPIWTQPIAHKAYAIEPADGDSAEIVLYGDLISEPPVDGLGNPIEGQYILLSAFLADLKQVEHVSRLTVRIHSAGGSAYDAMVIHNRLKALSAEITVIVDGVAMSGGSLILCAGDKVQVYPGSLVMIHKCWSFLFGGYNATELRRMAESNDAVDRAQAAIYHTKTGIPEDELLNRMEQETYMTGQEAVDNGFADELVNGASVDIAASADHRTLFVGGRPVWACTRKDGIPAALNLPTVNSGIIPPIQTTISQLTPTDHKEGGDTSMDTTIQTKAVEPPIPTALVAIPTAYEEDIATAIHAEQMRIQEIDEMSGLFDAEIINAAKYGAQACTAQEMTFRAAQKAAKQGKQFLTSLEEDATASGAWKVGAAAPGAEREPMTPAQRMAMGRADAQAMQKKEVQ